MMLSQARARLEKSVASVKMAAGRLGNERLLNVKEVLDSEGLDFTALRFLCDASTPAYFISAVEKLIGDASVVAEMEAEAYAEARNKGGM
jgi:hypothetical protein